ncbi:ChrR family anti-sigma-E factor [Maricaulis sp.]|uniref:ChrR family anti-sigma-E factor n=1 Tax=Maricaulis sp. TaxID=1486257 RepID=UPI002602451C|nr:ChrR family anti-sigma-E factor [Maricaulis sp.]
MTERGQMMDDAWYMDYAAGSLDSVGEEVLIASHLELSGTASERVAELERIGAALLMVAGDETELSFSADDIFDMDAPASAPTPLAANDIDSEIILPEALKSFLTGIERDVKWEFLGPGLQKAMLWDGPEQEKLWLLKAKPGVAIPHHGHNGSELTLVLKGSFHDGEQQYSRGDVEEAGPDTEHDIRIDEGEECICLALTRGKLRYDSPLLKLFQVFTGL